MGKRGQTVSQAEWESYDKQLRALHKDWHYLLKLIEGYAQSRFDRRELEVAFVNLKVRISCDYPLLVKWRAQGNGLSGDIGAFFDHGATLKSLAEDAGSGSSRTLDEWQLVDEALGYIRQLLQEAGQKAKPGKPIRLPETFFSIHAAQQDIDKYMSQFNAFRADWRRLHDLLQISLRPGADRGALETEFIRLRSKLSCDYPTLPRWFGGRDDISCGIGRILANGTSLEALADGLRRGGRTREDWNTVGQTVDTVCSELGRARAALQNGKGGDRVDNFFTPPGRRRVPFKKIAARVATVLGVVALAGTVYVMRTYLGYWAPEPGAGIEINASLEDSQKVDAILAVMTRACAQADVDMFMTAIARDFRDDAGNGRRALRVIVQAYNAAGRMEHAWLDWKRTRVTRQDEWVYATPVLIRSNLEDEDLITLRVGFKQYGDRWLVAYAEGHN